MMMRTLVLLLFLLSACQFTPADNSLAAVTAKAQAGDAKAQSSLAAMYYHGRGVTQDYKAAFDWYSKAAEQGYADAQYNLAVAYLNGQGVKRNYVKAAEWSTKAAEQGHIDAQYNLAGAYLGGQGVAQNEVQAYIWFSIAAAQGDADAAKSRDALAVRLSAEKQEEAKTGITGLQEKIAQNRAAKK
jgi:TPR repeat protein